MSIKQSDLVSAQVILKPASGGAGLESREITSDILPDLVPSAEVTAGTMRFFGSVGFEVGPMVGVSYSISGTVRQFEQTFGIRLREGADGRIECLSEGGEVSDRLPLDGLPVGDREGIEAVVFGAPPDFGPTDY